MPSAFAMGTRVEQPGKFLSCASRASRRHLEDLASSLHGLPPAVEDFPVLVPRRNWALLLQGEFCITLRAFRVEVPDEALADLRRRIAATRLPSKELVADRSQGVQLATIQELARHWAAEYDWRACEAKLNALPQFTTEIDGVVIHFIHVKSPHTGALPLIMTHGWPGSVIELLGTVGPLTDPAAHGGQAEDAFDLVLPSIPGYGF